MEAWLLVGPSCLGCSFIAHLPIASCPRGKGEVVTHTGTTFCHCKCWETLPLERDITSCHGKPCLLLLAISVRAGVGKHWREIKPWGLWCGRASLVVVRGKAEMLRTVLDDEGYMWCYQFFVCLCRLVSVDHTDA